MRIRALHSHKSGFAISGQGQTGFTIVELMIATMVFSTIMVVITFGVIHFTSGYYKGLNSSTTQNTARNIIDTISQAVQFSGTTIQPNSTDSGSGISYFCANNKIYLYKLGTQFMGTTNSTTPGLYVISEQNGCVIAPVGAGLFTGGTQLLSKHMRIAGLSVTKNADFDQAYTIDIRLAYSSGGDPAHDGDDLLCSNIASDGSAATPGDPGTCRSGTANPDLTNTSILSGLTCRGSIGSQFCAVSALRTTVEQRVTSSELSS